MFDEQSDPYYCTARLWDDGLIEPADTRDVLGLCLAIGAMEPPVDRPAARLPDVGRITCALSELSSSDPLGPDRQSRRDRAPRHAHLRDGSASAPSRSIPTPMPTPLHVRAADEAIRIGPAAGPRQLSRHGRHPGSRQAIRRRRASIPATASCRRTPRSCARCEAAGLIFVGPSAVAVEKMGSKIESKRIAEAAGVPTVPGYHGDAQDR